MNQTWVLTVKNLLLPQFCKSCGVRLLTEENGFFCPTCWELSPRVERPFCSKCGRPHPAMAGLGGMSNFPCADCREKPNKHIRRIYAAACYAEAVEVAVKLLKFNDKERLAPVLGELLVAFAQAEMDRDAYDFIVPVPLHKVRERHRGFNQSRALAQEAAPAFPRARIDESLQRIRPTRTQSKLRGKARRSNLRGAFAVIGDVYAGKSILLIDDVVTTGGTVTECARALRRAKAAQVDVLAVAIGV